MERQRAVRKPPESLGAWEAYQRGLWHMGRIGEAENTAAVNYLQRAIDLDPNFAAAHAELAIAMLQGVTLYQTSTISEVMNKVVSLAQRAVSLDPFDPLGQATMVSALTHQGDPEGAVAHGRQAIALGPNSARAHGFVASALLYSGQPRQALDAYRNALRLDPHDPMRHVRLYQMVNAHYFMREYEAAIEIAKEALRSYPDSARTYTWLAAALGQVGRSDDAKRGLQKAIALNPKQFDMFARQRAPWFRVEDYEHMLEGLRKAGWQG
jgi:adenylate cyclase